MYISDSRVPQGCYDSESRTWPQLDHLLLLSLLSYGSKIQGLLKDVAQRHLGRAGEKAKACVILEAIRWLMEESE